MKQVLETPPARNNLPLRLDTFVGRDGDVALLADLLDDHRLVTLTGPPGIGKTRLGAEVAASRLDAGPDGVWLVGLASVVKPDLVAKAVAAVLSVRPRPKQAVPDGLVAHIGNDNMLLVLDNCEHVLDACAQLAEALLAACPNLSILATSQERLSIAGEHVWPVVGLEIAEHQAGAASSHAVRLFDERARSALPTFRLDSDNVASVVEICRRLDGIPLAIELAAARIGMLPPAEISRHLDDRFELLTGGSRAALPRHQTLRAALDWSYDLLGEQERAMLRRLSVFAGGATLDAIEQVCAGGEVGSDRCLALITTLVARSLVTVDSSSAEPRYRLLETIRFYGRDRLAESGEITTLATRHLRWGVSLAESAEAELNGPDQQSWLSRLEADHDNLRAAMSWSLDQGPTDNALRLSGALAMFWRINSHFAEGAEWLDRALAVGAEAPKALRAKALWGKALLALMLARFHEARPAAEESLELHGELGDLGGVARTLLLFGSGLQRYSYSDNVFVLRQAIALARQAGDDWCLAYALASCGSILGLMGDSAAARLMLEESITVARVSGDRQCTNYGLVALAHVALYQGDYRSAEPALEDALANADAAYDTVTVRTSLAEVALGKGDHDRARALLDQALEDYRQTGFGKATVDLGLVSARLALAEGDLDSAEHVFNEVLGELWGSGATSNLAIRGLGEVALARGDCPRAAALFQRALAEATRLGQKRHVAIAQFGLGNVARLNGDLVAATTLHRQALDLRVQNGDLPGVAASLEALAGLAACSGQVEKAALVFGAAEALRNANSYSRPSRHQAAYEADVAIARDALGVESFDAAWAQGGSVPVETAVGYLAKGRGPRAKRPVSGVAALTEAERQVTELALQGLTNNQIAETLFITVHTVKTHMRKVFEKLVVSSRSQLISQFQKTGI